MKRPDPSRFSRRRVLQFAGLAASAATFPTACRALTTQLDSVEAETAPSVNAAKSGKISRVVLIKTDDRVAGTRRAIDLLQPDGIAGKTIFLKPNYNTADPAPAATDTQLLEALIRELQNAKAGQITIGDRSGMANTREAMTTKGVFQLAERYDVNPIVLDELSADDWKLFPAEGTHWNRGFAVARPILNAGAIVNTCCLKTHRFGGHFTLSLKNSVGMVA